MSPSVPVVDLGPLADGGASPARDRVVGEIAAACRDYGFFQVVEHDVPDTLLERVWEQTRRFFALPRAEKRAIARSAENPRGYYDRELTKNARDLKEVFDFGYLARPDLPDDHPANRADVDGANQWPASLPAFRATMLEHFESCAALGRTLFEAFCLGLELPPDTLHACFEGHTSFVRLNYYPLTDPLAGEDAAAAARPGDMALGHHTDAGALTILLQDDVGGLQVFHDGDWIDVEPVAGAFVINIGDMTQVWSNDRYRAALHRVRPMRGRARYSIPFFYNPSYETDCAPLVDRSAPRYRPINWGEFRRARTAGDYADHGKEIQIEDFRIGGHQE
ncbi:MAG: 2-oxoglutarate and iron-dependent oxygenase domain-containing protein [Gemmatimonadota bacterium]|nr:2-oxoglutarate and iron-dependent oxygenase domain-containing protein [Gemmatimonadota bacterium]